MGNMLALAEAFQKGSNGNKMEEWEAKALNMSVEKYRAIKDGYIETYKIVTDTFEKGYKMPRYKRSGWKACGNY